MKTLFALILSALPLIGLGQVPIARTNVLVTFDYPPSALSTTIVFHYFSTTNLSVPVSNWTWRASEPCAVGKTNYGLWFTVEPHSQWFTAGASNVSGMALFPGAAELPSNPRSDSLLLVR